MGLLLAPRTLSYRPRGTGSQAPQWSYVETFPGTGKVGSIGQCGDECVTQRDPALMEGPATRTVTPQGRELALVLPSHTQSSIDVVFLRTRTGHIRVDGFSGPFEIQWRLIEGLRLRPS